MTQRPFSVSYSFRPESKKGKTHFSYHNPNEIKAYCCDVLTEADNIRNEVPRLEVIENKY